MANNILFHNLHFFVVFVILLCLTPIEANNISGFSAQLIRRNSPYSPLYVPHELQKIHKSQSFYQVQNTNNGAAIGATANKGEYLMKLSIGTPPVDIYGVVDTGSDLIWTQCKPCDRCYKQKNPLFDPRNSKTYGDMKCDSVQCSYLKHFCSGQNLCAYIYGYGDGSVTKGFLAKERASFRSIKGNVQIAIGDVLFGCGYHNVGTFNDDEMGVIGLGYGPLSLVSQISNHFGGPRRFSQCLVPFHTDPSIPGTISFGDESVVSGAGVVTTPLFLSHYSVTLRGISVGDKFVPFSTSSQENSLGNIIIDSGTPATYLPQDFYDRLVGELKAHIRMAPISNDPSLGTQLCYRSNKNLEGPILIAHFDHGADVKLMPYQTFIPPREGVFCFAMAGTRNGLNIFGNFAQSNILIGFDIDAKTVSFKPTDCTKNRLT